MPKGQETFLSVVVASLCYIFRLLSKQAEILARRLCDTGSCPINKSFGQENGRRSQAFEIAINSLLHLLNVLLRGSCWWSRAHIISFYDERKWESSRFMFYGGRGRKNGRRKYGRPMNQTQGKSLANASKTAGGLHGVNMSTVKNCCVNQYYLKYHHGTDTQRLQNSYKLKDFHQNIQNKSRLWENILHDTRLMKTSTHCAVLI